jgi:voltage-gated sodium channel
MQTCYTTTYDRVARLVCSSSFDLITGSIVLLNSISIGAETDYIATNQTLDLPRFFRISEQIFCTCFVTELAMRLFVHRCAFFYESNWKWNWFDFFVVNMQLVEEFAVTLDGIVDLSALRVLRVMRLIRVIRVVRILRLIGELRTLATSIMHSMMSLMWTVIMLIVLMFIVGVTLTQIVSDHRMDSTPGEHHLILSGKFGSVYRSMLTLYQCNTGGMDWKDATDPLDDYNVSIMLTPLFCLYVAFFVLAIMNVVTGVFVESALKSAKDDKERTMVNHMQELFNAQCDSSLTWEDFIGMIDNPILVNYFQTIDVDPNEAGVVFKLLDANSDGELTEEEFMNGCLKLMGTARAMDLAVLSNEVHAIAIWMQSKLCNVERLLGGVQDEVKQSFVFTGHVASTSHAQRNTSKDDRPLTLKE